MRGWFPALALLAAAPAAAQDAPAWVGVWEGRVGTFPVRLCIDGSGDGPGRGSYYYRSRLEPIALTEEDGEGGWIERAPDGESQARWEFAEQTGQRLRGTWHQGRRSLPFSLTPVPWTEGEWGGPCSSAAFLTPRIGSGRVVTAAAQLAGWRYTVHTYQPPAQFAEDVAVETFSFPPEQPGDAAIGAVLAGYLPRGTVDDEFIQCMAGNIASLGTDGFFFQDVAPTMASPRFLTVSEATEGSCGGAHPNNSVVFRTFDRSNGREIDLFDWIGAPAAEERIRLLSEAQRASVLRHWPADPDIDPACREVVADEAYWGLELRREGLAFWPQVPRVAMACGSEGLLTWAELAPFLNREGRAGLARLQGE